MLHYDGEKIGERGGFTHRMGGNFHFVVSGFLLKEDGCMAVGVMEDGGRINSGWTDGFNRSKAEVVEQVNKLPLTKEEKISLLMNGIYPEELKLEGWLYSYGYPKRGEFDEYLDLVK